MKSNINIYSHHHYLNYFNSIVADFKNRKIGPKSMGEWARRLGYQSPRSFGMVINGKRLPSEEMLDSLSSYLELGKNEKEYLTELVKIEKKKRKNQPLETCLDRLQRLNPHINHFVEINPISFSFIAKWYHYVLKEFLRGEKQYKEDYSEIVKILNNKISIKEAKEAVKNLIRLGFVKRNEVDGTLISKDIDLMTPNGPPREAIKLHHEGMLEQAKQALREQDTSEREFQAFTFKMNEQNMPAAKEYLRNMVKEFNQKFCDENEKNVYQLNMHIFSHTKNKRTLQ